jgi:hypothetical protein
MATMQQEEGSKHLVEKWKQGGKPNGGTGCCPPDVEAGDIFLHMRWPIFAVRGKKYKDEKAVEGQKHQILRVEVVCAVVRVVDQRDLFQYLLTPLSTAENARTRASRAPKKNVFFTFRRAINQHLQQ